MASPIKFVDFLSENRDLDEAGFLTRHPYPFLVSEGSNATSSAVDLHGTEATTKMLKPDSSITKPAGDSSAPSSSEGPWIVPVRRGPASKLAIITVGRGEECDVRLSHPLVSKKHAYFKQDEGEWCLSDADSTNGTFADGIKLEAHKTHKLAEGEALRFGPSVKYRYFTPRAFYEYLSYRARMRDAKTR